MSSYQQTKSLPRHVFRAYDIRGRVGLELDENAFYALGLALGSLMHEASHEQVVVGYDGRLSSPSLGTAMMTGLKHTGLKVINIGLAPSPLLYYATKKISDGAGVMITGSHNGKEYNGIKPVVNGKNLTGAEIAALYERVSIGKFQQGRGELVKQEIVSDYIKDIVADINTSRRLNIAIDCGNGVAGFFVGELFRQLGHDVVELYCEVDGEFPNHHPDPAVDSNLADLQALVLEKKLDLGLAFDGDADRLGVVDSSGQIIRADRILMLLAREMLRHHPASPIVYDVKCSRVLKTLISSHQGEPIMCPTGHSIVKRKMAETGALLAGEMSGHLFIKDRWNGFDDAIYAACRMLEVICAQSKTSKEVFDKYTAGFSTPELKIAIAEEKKFEIMERIKSEVDFSPADCNFLDGVRCELPDSWGLIRASNTTPNLVLRFEGETPDALDHIKAWFKQKLNAFAGDLSFPY